MIQLGYFLLFHLLFDFYFQSNRLAEIKEKSCSGLMLHCLIYSLGLTVAAACLLNTGALLLLAVGAFFFLSHFVIDGPIRSIFVARVMSPVGRLAIDQVLHVVILAVISLYFDAGQLYSEPVVAIMNAHAGELTWIATFCFCGRPSSITVADMLQSVRTRAHAEPNTVLHSGKWIGILERLIVSSLSLLGQYSAIAFVFTAKSIARFKQLESEKDFAEIYLLGTLSSVFLAMASAIVFGYLFSTS